VSFAERSMDRICPLPQACFIFTTNQHAGRNYGRSEVFVL
jgi:hypothetical protein